MRLLRALLSIIALVSASMAVPAQTILPAEQSFTVTAEQAEGGLAISWSIAPGIYLYRDHIAVRSETSEPVPFSSPNGAVKDDPNFGSVEIYRDRARILVASEALPSAGSLLLTFQGCTDAGLCYPPVHRKVDLKTLSITAVDALSLDEPTPALAEAGGESALLASSSPTWTVIAFFGFGLLLSLTPCMYPMVPILAGILAGPNGHKPGWRRGFALSSAYVLAMALAYALLGAGAAWSGVNLQAVLQAPWALGLMATVLIVLALGMFGAFELTLPFGLGRSSTATQPAGGVLRAASLGFGAALIVGPCVTPPLAAALLYIAQSGDLAKGAAALFALGLGMGVPLVAFGTFGGQLLPRSGLWLVKVRQFFGFVMVGAALVLIARMVPGYVAVFLWAALAISVGVFLGAFDSLQADDGLPRRMFKAGGVLAIIYGGVLTVGAGAGASDPLRPLAVFGVPMGQRAAVAASVETVNSPEALDAALKRNPDQKPVLVQFTADWCTICKDIEREVLTDPGVQAAAAGFLFIKADVTRDGADTRALMRRMQVVGPPTFLVLDSGSHREIPEARTTGMTSASEFTTRLTAARRAES